MKSRTECVALDAVRDVRRQIANYKRFKALTTEWVDLGIEHSRLKMKLPRTFTPTDPSYSTKKGRVPLIKAEHAPRQDEPPHPHS
jgi:hypothetical protein